MLGKGLIALFCAKARLAVHTESGRERVAGVFGGWRDGDFAWEEGEEPGFEAELDGEAGKGLECWLGVGVG